MTEFARHQGKSLHEYLNTFLPPELSCIVFAYQKSLCQRYESEWSADSPFDPANMVSFNDFLYLLPNKRIPVNIYCFEGNQLILKSMFQLNIQTKQNEVLKSFTITDRFMYYLYERSIIIQSRTNDQILVNRILPDTFGAINTSYSFRVDSDQVIYWTILAKHFIYYTDLSNVNRIEKFGESQGGNGPQQFSDPFDLAVDKKNLYICDHGNYRIQVIDKKTGEHKYHFGQRGKDLGQFSNPTRILLHEDLLLVTEWYNVQFFNKETGQYIYRIGKKERGEGPEGFDRIRGICMLEDRVCVVDCTCRIQVFA